MEAAKFEYGNVTSLFARSVMYENAARANRASGRIRFAKEHVPFTKMGKKASSSTHVRFPLGLFVVLITILILILGQYAILLKPLQNIASIDVSNTQEISGLIVQNYTALLAKNVVWESLSENERVATARYAAKATIIRAVVEGKHYFNLIGLDRKGGDCLFSLCGGEQLTLYCNGIASTYALDG